MKLPEVAGDPSLSHDRARARRIPCAVPAGPPARDIPAARDPLSTLILAVATCRGQRATTSPASVDVVSAAPVSRRGAGWRSRALGSVRTLHRFHARPDRSRQSCRPAKAFEDTIARLSATRRSSTPSPTTRIERSTGRSPERSALPEALHALRNTGQGGGTPGADITRHHGLGASAPATPLRSGVLVPGSTTRIPTWP